MKHTSKNILDFSLKLCVIMLKMVLYNGFDKHFQLHLKRLKETAKSRQFNVMPMEKNDMGLNLF